MGSDGGGVGNAPSSTFQRAENKFCDQYKLKDQ